MQLNQALFMLGGGSGYVPQPDIMRDDMFDPFDKDTLHVEPITIQLQVRLTKQDRGSLIVQLSQSWEKAKEQFTLSRHAPFLGENKLKSTLLLSFEP